MPSFNFFAALEAVFWSGAKPCLIDLDPLGPIDFTEIEKYRTTKTKAIILPSLFGFPALLDPILKQLRSLGLRVIEDTCQAFGARFCGKAAGTRGDLGCFSFYPTKILGGFGDGGLIVTDDPELQEKLILLRNHGAARGDKYVHRFFGKNSRLDEIQAALLRIKLASINTAISCRQSLAKSYRQRLASVPSILLPPENPDAEPVYYSYPIRSENRDGLKKMLKEKGIEALVHFPIPLHQQPAFLEKFGRCQSVFPRSEVWAEKILSLPCHPQMSSENIRFISESIQEWAEKKDR